MLPIIDFMIYGVESPDVFKFKFTLKPREIVLKDRSTLGLNIEEYN